MCVWVGGWVYMWRMILSVGVLYLSHINPVAYDLVCSLGIFLRPLQVVGIVVSFKNPDRVGCVEVELSIVGLSCEIRGGQNVTDG